MHPDVHQDHPGRCPICGMALEKVSASEQKTRARGSARRARGGRPTPRAPRPRRRPPRADPEARAPVTLDGRRQQLIGVRTVDRDRAGAHPPAAREGHRAVRRVALDGRERPHRGLDPEAVRRADRRSRAARDSRCWRSTARSWRRRRPSTCSRVRTRDAMAGRQASTEQADLLVSAARQRLARWDLPDDHLAALTERREVAPLITFRSPVAGIVMEKRAVDGMRVMPGDSLYRIVDASMVWVEADVYESDVAMVRVGQRAEVTLEAWPGETFTGTGELDCADDGRRHPHGEGAARAAEPRRQAEARHVRAGGAAHVGPARPRRACRRAARYRRTAVRVRDRRRTGTSSPDRSRPAIASTGRCRCSKG